MSISPIMQSGIYMATARAAVWVGIVARTDNPASSDWTARAALQGEANGRIKKTVS